MILSATWAPSHSISLLIPHPHYSNPSACMQQKPLEVLLHPAAIIRDASVKCTFQNYQVQTQQCSLMQIPWTVLKPSTFLLPTTAILSIKDSFSTYSFQQSVQITITMRWGVQQKTAFAGQRKYISVWFCLVVWFGFFFFKGMLWNIKAAFGEVRDKYAFKGTSSFASQIGKVFYNVQQPSLIVQDGINSYELPLSLLSRFTWEIWSFNTGLPFHQ